MFTNLVIGTVERTKSILMVWANFKCFVIRKQTVEVGQCSKKDRTALLISTGDGMTTNGALVISTASFGSGWRRSHRLTSSSSYKLRVDLEDINSKTSFAKYSSFDVASESSKYRLRFGSFSGKLTSARLW